jgi:replicative DNA helicase
MQGLLNVMNRLSDFHLGIEECAAIRSGFGSFDKTLNGGFKRNNLYVLSGHKNIGKTAFMISILVSMLHKTDLYKAGVISLDRTAEEWMERMLSNLSEVPLELIARGKLTEEDLQKVTSKASSTRLESLEVKSFGYIDLEHLVEVVRNMVTKENVKIIFIDSLEFIAFERVKGAEFRIHKVLSALKELVAELDIPIVISVSKKGKDKREDENDLSGFRSDRNIAQFGDVVMVLYQTEHVTQRREVPLNSLAENEIHLKIVKNNTGPLETIAFTRIAHIQKFEEQD